MKHVFFIILLFSLLLQSCDTCKHIPTYGGRARMIYGHETYGGNMKAAKNPYFVKAKKSRWHYHNYYN